MKYIPNTLLPKFSPKNTKTLSSLCLCQFPLAVSAQILPPYIEQYGSKTMYHVKYQLGVSVWNKILIWPLYFALTRTRYELGDHSEL